MRKIKCFTKESIEAANSVAGRRNYNRQLTKAFIRSLPDGKWFPVVFTMIHEHAQGNKVDPHMRCWVEYDSKGGRFFIDCDMDIYKSLSSFDFPSEKDVENYA